MLSRIDQYRRGELVFDVSVKVQPTGRWSCCCMAFHSSTRVNGKAAADR
jgi:hypothetical protein